MTNGNEPEFKKTKREYFAAMAMQGLLSVYDNGNGLVPNIGTANYMANLSVAAADALINALNETK